MYRISALYNILLFHIKLDRISYEILAGFKMDIGMGRCMLYQVYCKILSNVIREAKRIYYDKKIKKSSNKYKTTCDITKKPTNNQHSQIGIQELTKDSKYF